MIPITNSQIGAKSPKIPVVAVPILVVASVGIVIK